MIRKITVYGLFIQLIFSAITLCGQGVVPSSSSGYDEIFKTVEKMPRFPGCEHIKKENERSSCSQVALLAYIDSTVVYPPGLTGIVGKKTAVITFTVTKNGHLRDAKIARDPGEEMGAAALTVVQRMIDDSIQWIPGKHHGRNVNVQFNIPVRFVPQPSPPPPLTQIENKGYRTEQPRFISSGCESIENVNERRECAQEALLAYVYSELVYPPGLTLQTGKKTAIVSFVITRKGKMTKLRISRDPGAGTGKAALAVIKKMAADNLRWVPGKLNGEALNLLFHLPVKFEEEK